MTNPPRQDTDQITAKRTVWVAVGFARQDSQQPRQHSARVCPVGNPFAAHIWAPSRAPNRICDDATAPQIMSAPCLPCLRGTSCALSFVLGWVGWRWTRDSSKREDDDRWGDISTLKANGRWRRCRWRVQAEEIDKVKISFVRNPNVELHTASFEPANHLLERALRISRCILRCAFTVGRDIGARPFLFLACRLRRKLGHEEGPAVGKREK